MHACWAPTPSSGCASTRPRSATASLRSWRTGPRWSSKPVPDDDGPVSEPEQEQLLQALHRHLAAGRLDLEQFDARAARLYGAETRAGARAALEGLPLREATPPRGRRGRRRQGEGEPVQPHGVATDEVFRAPPSGGVMGVWVAPPEGSRHYAETGP